VYVRAGSLRDDCGAVIIGEGLSTAVVVTTGEEDEVEEWIVRDDEGSCLATVRIAGSADSGGCTAGGDVVLCAEGSVGALKRLVESVKPFAAEAAGRAMNWEGVEMFVTQGGYSSGTECECDPWDGTVCEACVKWMEQEQSGGRWRLVRLPVGAESAVTAVSKLLAERVAWVAWGGVNILFGRNLQLISNRRGGR
jgi:hypothetical protein